MSAPVPQRRDVESILSSLTKEPVNDFVIDAPSHVQRLKKQGKTIYNGLTYTMNHVSLDQGLVVQCGTGYYYDAMETCDALEWEILTYLGMTNLLPTSFAQFKTNLRLRNRYHNAVSNPIFDGSGRSAVLSISTLIVFNDGDTYRAFLRTRSNKTAAGAGAYHVVPSFIFQPTLGDVEREYSVKHNIFREYLEEVFGVADMEQSRGEVAFDWFYSDKRITQLSKLLRTGKAELYLTGYAVDMVNLRPEICTLLIVKDKDWTKQPIVTNWEFLTPQQVWEKKQPVLLPIDVLADDSQIQAELASIPSVFVPTGAAAFWLGLDIARAVLSKR